MYSYESNPKKVSSRVCSILFIGVYSQESALKIAQLLQDKPPLNSFVILSKYQAVHAIHFTVRVKEISGTA